MKNSESKQILNNQKNLLNKISTEKKQLLLQCNDDINKHDSLKRKLGWIDTDNIIDNSIRKVIELEDVQSKIVDSNIFTLDSIMKYCINNNYVLCSITEYKGSLDNELLEAIDNYATSKNLSLTSGAELDCLYLLCPLKDVKTNSDDVKKSKRYKKSNLSKLLLLEKVTDRRTHSEDYFNLIFEIGNRKPITNLINSIFRTYTKTGNLLNNSLFFTSIFMLLFIIGILIKNNIYSWYILPIASCIVTIILILKAWLDSTTDSGTFNICADNDFRNYHDVRSKQIIERYNYVWLFKKYYKDSYLNNYKQLAYNKFLISAIIIIGLSALLMQFTIRINKMIILNDKDITTVSNKYIKDDGKPYINYCEYHKTGILTYDKYEHEEDMSSEAIDKRRKEAYDKAHKK